MERFLRTERLIGVGSIRLADFDTISRSNINRQLYALESTIGRAKTEVAIDSLNPKIELLSYAYKNSIPIISSMGAALRTDPLQIQTGNIFDTTKCPLSKQVRKRLRNRGVGRGIDCVYSTEIINFTYTDPEEETEGEDLVIRGLKRRVLGSLPTLPGIFGLILANMAYKELLNLYSVS
ncbi:MAG: ThiF family adenylyltransferase [Spirochaetia bacterium]|jgi:tRNA A37 threonylcarbamoyladenosine dehydratase|nr:ThiF family adenylyltransferase [Spirochaetia bacterium]